MARAAETVALRSIALSLAQMASVIRGNPQNLEPALTVHQTILEDRSLHLAETIEKVHADLAINPAPSVNDPALVGELTFITGPTLSETGTEEDSNLKVFSRSSGSFFWISAVYTDQASNLVEQTRPIMSGIERSLAAQEMSSDNVTKLTAHYVGGASSEELQGNMTVRHSYYSPPGPASTGLPVSRLLGPNSRISIDAVALV